MVGLKASELGGFNSGTLLTSGLLEKSGDFKAYSHPGADRTWSLDELYDTPHIPHILSTQHGFGSDFGVRP